ncbi:MAG: NAD-dependent epimerase/dehydratase family protein [Thermoleophilaceae bacterium]
MAKTLVTGGTGFVGSHVAHLLAARGDELRLTVRDGSRTQSIDDLDCERVKCDVLDRRALRRALKGVDRVFHVAGVSSLDPADAERVVQVNLHGTKAVMEESMRAGVRRVVYTSSSAAFGPADPGGTADETQLFRAGRLGIPYVNAVHEGEVEALRLAAKGLPVVCVNPCIAFGAGDVNLASTRLVRDFLLGRLPLYTDGAINVVDVRDVARGHLLADERGGVGERYILGGRNFTYDRLFADLGRLSGVAPPVKVPARLATGSAALLAAAGRSLPLTPEEVSAASHWWTYRSTKARRELAWRPRPHEETLEATVAWHLEREHERIARTRGSQHAQYRAAGLAMGALDGMVGVASRVWRRTAALRP